MYPVTNCLWVVVCSPQKEVNFPYPDCLPSILRSLWPAKILQDASICLHVASGCLPPRCLQVGPRCLQTTSRSLFVGSSRCQDGQHGIQKPPKVLIMASRGTRDGLYKWKKVALATAKATCLLLQALGPLGVLYASKRSQDNLKMAPRWLKLA